jgi:hypothetical protein
MYAHYFFFLSAYDGVPREGTEMGPPHFFTPSEIPYHEMMPADKLFLPKIFAGEKLVLDVYFGKTEDGSILIRDKKTIPAL